MLKKCYQKTSLSHYQLFHHLNTHVLWNYSFAYLIPIKINICFNENDFSRLLKTDYLHSLHELYLTQQGKILLYPFYFVLKGGELAMYRNYSWLSIQECTRGMFREPHVVLVMQTSSIACKVKTLPLAPSLPLACTYVWGKKLGS